MIHRIICMLLAGICGTTLIAGNTQSIKKKKSNTQCEEIKTPITLKLDETKETELIYIANHNNKNLGCKFCYALNTYGVKHLEKTLTSPKEISGFLTKNNKFITNDDQEFMVVENGDLLWLQQKTIIVTYDNDTATFSDMFGNRITIEGTNIPTTLLLQHNMNQDYVELLKNECYKRTNETSFKKFN